MRHVLGWEHPWYAAGSVPAPTERARILCETEAFIDLAEDPVYWVDYDRPFRKFRPSSEEDAAEGGRCSRTGFWYPASKLVDDGGAIVGCDQVREEPDEG